MRNVEKIRPITITVASIAFIIFGLVTIVYAVLLGIAFSSAMNLSETDVLIVAGLIFLVVMLGALDITAGYGLWYMKRWAAIMGMLLSIFGIIVQSFSYSLIYVATYNGYSAYNYALSTGGAGSPWVYIILIILIAISWKSFEPSAI